MQTLVTGGAGFIGSHIVDALLAAGHAVAVVDNLSHGKRSNVPAQARLFEIDITDDALADCIAEVKPATVFHLAAQMDVRRSVEDPLFDAQTNVAATARLLAAAARAGTQTLIFSSTGGAIYGEQERFPADESHPCNPESPYGVSKYCAEQYLAYYGRKTQLRTVALRYANVYGPRQDPHGEAGVVAIFSGKCLAGEQATIFGDGSQTRDYVFVGDVVRANMLAMNNSAARGAYNIGTGIETDVATLGQLIADAAGYQGSFHYAPARPGEQQRSVISAARAHQELGWAPQTDLTEGLTACVSWFRA